MSKTKSLSLIGEGVLALELIIDADSLVENQVGLYTFDSSYGPTALVGTATLGGRIVTVIVNDSKVRNPRFPVVIAGVIGLEEGYKMAAAVYQTIEADIEKQPTEKRPLLLVVDTPGNSPGKVEEIIGINKATAAYQLALAEAREKGHPVIAMIIGRAISGGFLCHGLQADRILTLSSEYNTMIHVMPLSSIARIIRMDIERLEELSVSNPVFASGASHFYKLGGVEEIIEDRDNMTDAIIRNINEIYELNSNNRSHELGPLGRSIVGAERGGRKVRKEVIEQMETQFSQIESGFL